MMKIAIRFLLFFFFSSAYACYDPAPELPEQNCKFTEYEIADLLINPASELINKCNLRYSDKNFREMAAQIQKFWSPKISDPERYAMLTDAYKDRLNKRGPIKSELDYRIPASRYEKGMRGYKINYLPV